MFSFAYEMKLRQFHKLLKTLFTLFFLNNWSIIKLVISQWIVTVPHRLNNESIGEELAGRRWNSQTLRSRWSHVKQSPQYVSYDPGSIRLISFLCTQNKTETCRHEDGSVKRNKSENSGMKDSVVNTRC